MDAPDNRFKWDAPIGVGLGIEEDFHVANILLRGTLKIGPGQIKEILLGEKRAGSFIIDIQERLEIVKAIRLAKLLDRLNSKGQVIAPGHLAQQFRLQCALNMHMQLCFWKIANELDQIVRGYHLFFSSPDERAQLRAYTTRLPCPYFLGAFR